MAFDQISYYFESSGTLIGFDSEPYVIAGRDSILEKLSLTEDAWNLLVENDTQSTIYAMLSNIRVNGQACE